MKHAAAVLMAAVVLAGAGLRVGYCEKASTAQTPQFQRIYGTVESVDDKKQTLTVKLSSPADAAVTVKLTEWTRVVRENEDLTIGDLKAGVYIMMVYRSVAGQGMPEAETINFEEKP